MLTPDDRTGQGAQKGYLRSPDKFRGFDPEVFDYLNVQADNESPDIFSMERAGPIDPCRFYWAPFPSDLAERERYFAGCLKAAVNTDLVFLDPDNGPMPARPDPDDLDKYVLWDEISRMYCDGHSVMVFNFLRGGTSQKDGLVTKRRKKLQRKLLTAYVTVLRTHDLAFYFATHQRHSKAVHNAGARLTKDWENLPLWQAH